MSVVSLVEMLEQERAQPGPWLTAPRAALIGGVDPLGLRQINFDLMDRVFPGLNNVARHIRPFVLVTWAWQRTLGLAKKRGLDLNVSIHEDFVARIEAAFIWSLIQEQDGTTRRVDLPGHQRITELCASTGALVLGDKIWTDFVAARRDSTALTAAINYGPGLRAYHWLEDDRVHPGLRLPHDSATAALQAFENRLAPALGHDLFNGYEPCTVTREEAMAWRDLWDLDRVTGAERAAMRARLIGDLSNSERRAGFALLATVATASGGGEPDIRKGMCDSAEAGNLATEALRWNRVQTRQAFRLALEAFLHWLQIELSPGPQQTEALARSFVAAAGGRADAKTADWLEGQRPGGLNPVDATDVIADALRSKDGLAAAIAAALAFCLSADAAMHDRSARDERLPLARARSEADRFAGRSIIDFIGHAIEKWVFTQHTYWSVGRGLADARSRSNPILRLRVALEQDGWTLTRGGGARSRSVPRATPDRLETAINLAIEAELIAAPGSSPGFGAR
jgi:hypothetical protein